ncbi:MAG: energy transducer TonB [Terriglobales bacterium]
MDFVPDFQTPHNPPLWRQLWHELRELVHPAPRPELQLESKPVPVKDIWSHENRTRQRLGSLAIHAVVIGVILLPIWHSVHIQPKQQVMLVPTLYAPGPSLPKMKRLAGGGAPVHMPAPPQLLPTSTVVKPVVAPIQLTPQTAMANVPLPQLAGIGPVAAPPGNSFGHSGAGPGGPGSTANGGGNCVSGICRAGGDVSEPIPIYEPDPEYSDAARRAKYQGTVVVAVIIGADGHIHNAKVIQHLGLGLDQKALEAVMLWRFQPARKDGQPVSVLADIEVNFHLY